MLMTTSRPKAVLYRMVLPDHLCPSGLKALDLLRRSGFEVDDRPLTTREATDAFKAEHGVKTTPQVFVDGARVGGYDDLRRFVGKPLPDPKATTYRPVLAVFAVAALLAVAVSHATVGNPFNGRALGWFLGFTTAILALLKLQDVQRFSTSFLNYDLLARRWVPYAYLYPYFELLVGVLMVAGALQWLAAPLALLIGSIGAWSVFKAVYLDRRELKCACVGGASNVPLGFVSLTENLAMVGMGAWMLAM